ncbi:helix-turn-helix transcriptional regulator [Myroides indicus]|uniref:Helix-turn-helix protein n=1 Tax=Myroides indicus TaxID=1323422 RepID=A0A4R7F8C7_9FLAO|nr:helix-turn-helix transcriptional regulator [Myroides indicus]TDS66219.1 helix-turn-helix protein [Myroides indicus]
MKINKLDEVFKSKSIKNRVLAKKMKKSEETISKWRNNKRQPSLENLYEIARLLRVNIQDLIEPTDWKNEKSETYDEFVRRMKE